jgi:hypothetical protein
MIQFRQTDIFFYYFYQNRSENGGPIVMKTLQQVLVLSHLTSFYKEGNIKYYNVILPQLSANDKVEPSKEY